jgi:hypothetical protein
MDWRERRDKALKDAATCGGWAVSCRDVPWESAMWAQRAAHEALTAMALDEAWCAGFDKAADAFREARSAAFAAEVKGG